VTGGRDRAALLGLVLLGGALALGPPVGVGAALLLLGGWLAWASPPAAVAAALVAVPWVFRPVPIGGRSFSLLEVAIVVGAAGLGPRLLASARTTTGRRRLAALVVPAAVTLPAIALLAVAALSLATVADPAYLAESRRELRTVILGPLVFFGLCRWSLGVPAPAVGRAPARALAAGAFLASGAAVAALALAEVATGAGVAADAVRRATGPYPHPNNLALYLERVAVLGVGAAVVSGARRLDGRHRWATGALAGVALLGLAASLSRGGLLGVTVGLVLAAWATGSRRVRLATAGGIAVMGASFALLAGDRLAATGGAGGALADATRMPIWRASLAMLRDYPGVGVGLDQFLYQYWPRYVEPQGWAERYTSHPHNLVLDLWLRLGILGLVSALWLGVAVVWAARRSGPRRAWAADPWRLGAAGALLAGLAHGLVDQGFFLPDLAVMTWFFVALVEVPLGSGAGITPQAARGSERRDRPVTPAAGESGR